MDQELLDLAKKKIEGLERNKALFGSLKFNTQIDAEKGTFGFTERPSEEVVKSAVLDIRHFIAPRSDLVMGKLIKIIRPKANDMKKKKIDEFYDVWKRVTGDKKSGQPVLAMSLNLDGAPVTQDKLIDLWLNGELFHTDVNKRKTLQMVKDNPFLGLLEMNFLITVQNLASLLILFKRRFLV